mgnify:CR=1 FL=1
MTTWNGKSLLANVQIYNYELLKTPIRRMLSWLTDKHILEKLFTSKYGNIEGDERAKRLKKSRKAIN